MLSQKRASIGKGVQKVRLMPAKLRVPCTQTFRP